MEMWQLKQRQSLPLEVKIELTKMKIRQWYDHWNGDVYVSFSGGKDSTVLLHLARQVYADIPAVYVDTGLEWPEIRQFVRETPNVTWIRPKMPFNKVIETYGYPVVSKEQSLFISEVRQAQTHGKSYNVRLHGNKWGRGKISQKWMHLVDAPFKVSNKCCEIMKKRPFKDFEKSTALHPIIGVMADESEVRTKRYMTEGCNAFKNKRPHSTPMAFWNEKDVWEYLRRYDVPYSPIYDMGYERTGCMFCMFGVHLEPHPNRFERMKSTHPQMWDYCINKLGCGAVMDYAGIQYGEEPPLLRLLNE